MSKLSNPTPPPRGKPALASPQVAFGGHQLRLTLRQLVPRPCQRVDDGLVAACGRVHDLEAIVEVGHRRGTQDELERRTGAGLVGDARPGVQRALLRVHVSLDARDLTTQVVDAPPRPIDLTLDAADLGGKRVQLRLQHRLLPPGAFDARQQVVQAGPGCVQLRLRVGSNRTAPAQHDENEEDGNEHRGEAGSGEAHPLDLARPRAAVQVPAGFSPV